MPNLVVVGQTIPAYVQRSAEKWSLSVLLFKVTRTDTDRSATYDFLLVIWYSRDWRHTRHSIGHFGDDSSDLGYCNRGSRTISEIKDFGRKSQIFTPLVFTWDFVSAVGRKKTRVMTSQKVKKKFEDLCIRLVRARWTDGICKAISRYSC